MLLAVVTALTLHFTLPTQDAITCSVPAFAPLDDLAVVEVHFLPRYQTADFVIYSGGVVGREGDPMDINVIVSGEGVLWIETADDVGNHSCPSNLIVVAETTDVPFTQHVEEPVVWYDIAGRKYVTAPQMPGVYIRKQGATVRKVVKLRKEDR